MNSHAYEEVCEWFQQLIELPSRERDQRLTALRREDKYLADQVEAMLLADKQAEEVDFLSNTDGELHETTCLPIDSNADSTVLENLVGMQIGSYRLEERVGAGGMGVVFRAYDLNSERTVAIKLIRAEALVDEEHRKRFRSEAIAAARMQHSNIVPVHEVGQDKGREFFTMTYVDGVDLKTVLKRGRLSPRKTASTFMKIAGALKYAHDRGVIHRDIKPANILIGPDGEPLLTDFGIAKRLDSGDDQTSTGQILGTVAYMAPEQIVDAKNVGPAADLYSVGATMYECLTGMPPFENERVIQLLADVRTRLPISPLEFHAEIGRDLEAICMRCLQKEPVDRYPSAEALLGDLRRYLDGEPLATSRPTAWGSIGRALDFREQHGPFESARAATWTLILSVAVHPTVFILNATKQSPLLLWTVLLAWGLIAGFVSWRYHWRQYWRISLVERQSGMISLAVNASFICLFLLHGPLALDRPISDFLDVYPPFCLVVAVAICAHAGIHAGRWLIYGSMFFPLALILVWVPFWSPLLFGGVGALAAGLIDRDLRATD